jgi:general transcription factor 3C polypeptide 3 (transcription factor C subunit 4)
LAADRDDLECRLRRAEVYIETGRHSKAIKDYQHALRLSPHNLDYVYHLSECYSREHHPQVAIPYYDEAIAFYRSQHTGPVSPSLWSHANIYAELHLMSKDYSQGLIKLKQFGRWILGRGADAFWDGYIEDDREFDAENFPRRTQAPQFNAEDYNYMAYGYGLPLELRLKLALFRLKLDSSPHDEAMVNLSAMLCNLG